MSTKTKEKEENWDGWVVFLLVIAVALLIFSIATPYIFTRTDEEGNYNFNADTGVIGDTFGVMNPFIGILGVIMTFLAFYIQIKANKIQRDQFKRSIIEDKLKEQRNEKLDAYNKLDLLSVSLETIISDIKERGEKINEYEKKLRQFPYQSHILKRTPSRDYSRVLEIDRLSIYKSFRFFGEKDQSRDFNRLYNLLDFLSEFFQDFYSKVTLFTKESFDQKMEIRNKVLQFLDQNANVLIDYQARFGNNFLDYPAPDLANRTIERNYEIINLNYDKDGNPISETDWNMIDEKLLKYFILQALELKDKGILDTTLVPIIEFASNIRKDISLIKNRTLEFSDEVKSQYDNLLIDGKNTSVITLLSELDKNIEQILEIARTETDKFYNA